ncbi:dihydroneopterin aldolase [Shimia marina]|uniref:dihydroneopterin aldolase n=1 Tax=Shimia marina TaxID=321267 RepID=A0A0P1EQ31_9RHOB|nr:dihydroneopterin aldolase [Shimia marina]CUH52543.1 bifunctional dihydroneopterin aldolase/dihydroneopterin triphosphate 2'-epimerase [Shimia marina]SFE49499.1 dihydroneopterin aldolase [Shimia marina]
MSNEIRLAFAHPSERAEATSSSDPLDRISLRDHIVEVEIGAFQAERGTTQRICFNVVVEVLPITVSVEDDVDRILSYDKVTEAIAFELAAERLNLLETLAARVADRVLLEPQAQRVFVRIEKLDRGPGALGVEIVRSRVTNLAPVEELQDEEPPQPRVVFLSNEAQKSPHLGIWIDQLLAKGQPLIFCVDAPEETVLRTGHAMTQRRVDLLAIEQNAWLLAARDARCVVVDTRTELEWAMKNGQTCVWAPSKIVLDAVDGPSAAPSETLDLALWFAQEMHALEVLAFTAATSVDALRGDVPLRVMPLSCADL